MNPISTNGNLIKIFSDDEIAKAFLDAFLETRKATSILKIDHVEVKSDHFNIPSVTLKATSKNNYDYTLHIQILNEDHLSEEFDRFLGTSC
jgi:hypothetical protein